MVRFYMFAVVRGKRYFAVPSPICDAHNLRIFEEDNARNIHYGKFTSNPFIRCRTAAADQGRRLVRRRRGGTRPPLSYSRYSDRRDGGLHRYDPAGGDGFRDLRGFRPRRACLRQRHRLHHLQYCADRRHHHRGQTGSGRSRHDENSGAVLFHRSCLLRRNCVSQRAFYPRGRYPSADDFRNLYDTGRHAGDPRPAAAGKALGGRRSA